MDELENPPLEPSSDSMPAEPPSEETPQERKRRLVREAQRRWRLAHPEEAAAVSLAYKQIARAKKKASQPPKPPKPPKPPRITAASSAKTREAVSMEPSGLDDALLTSVPNGTSPEDDPQTPEPLLPNWTNTSPISSGDHTPSSELSERHVLSREEARRLAEKAGQEITQFGRICDPFIVNVLNRNQKYRNVNDELLFQAIKDFTKTVFGEKVDDIALATGMGKHKVSMMLRVRPKFHDPRLTENQIKNEIELQNQTYSGRKDLIERLLEGAARYTEQALATVSQTRGVQASKAAAILLDKALLLAGQPTSRVSRVDERMMSSEDLHKKAQEYDEMLSRTGTDLRLVQGANKAD